MRKMMIAAVRFYQRHISSHTKPTCRFTPTCSEYAITAFTRFGTVRGFLLTAFRILRCNPFGGHGYDPVPERFTFRREKQCVFMDDEEADSLYDTELSENE